VEILKTERLVLRELDPDIDAGFIFELLNTPKFLKYIGDRGVRSVGEAAEFIEARYRQMYLDHGYGLYTVVLKEDGIPALACEQIGVCGFVKRENLPHADLGFAFLPQFERRGYGFESAKGVMTYGRTTLGLTTVLAITSLDNDASGKLLEKLGFEFDKIIESGEETLKLYRSEARSEPPG
jgi:RimJ/RimL family protein N-acetyltransferase